MEFSVVPAIGVHKALTEKRYDALLSITDPGEAPPPAIEYLHFGVFKPMEFHDLWLYEQFEGSMPPEGSTIREIIEFVRDAAYNRNCNTMLIHCHAGISRSSAAAIIGAKALGMDAGAFVHKLYADTGGRIYPNARMIQLAEEVLGPMYGEVKEAMNTYDFWQGVEDGSQEQG